MCGIIGYSGGEDAPPILLNGLKRLDYRGYDSCGIATVDRGGILIRKTKGRVEELEKIILRGTPIEAGKARPDTKSDGQKAELVTAGIGHTRWATHGEPNDVNAHPHLSASGRIVAVHNGIIENYRELKAFLIENGFVFRSETDSEVIAHLIEYYYKGDMTEAIKKASGRLLGSYSAAVLCADFPEVLYAVKRASPLVVGKDDKACYAASDVLAFHDRTLDLFFLNDGEIAELRAGSVKLYDSLGNAIGRKSMPFGGYGNGAEKDGYPHFMLKEINEQPDSIRRVISRYSALEAGRGAIVNFPVSDEFLKGIERIRIVACGSAYNAGLAAKGFLERMTGLFTDVCIASEFRYGGYTGAGSSLIVAVSQSGETADTLAALRESKKPGSFVLAVVNVEGSAIAREADGVIYTEAGPEIAVATTKGYTSQCIALYLTALKIASVRGGLSLEDCGKYIDKLLSLSSKLSGFLAGAEKGKLEALAKKYRKAKNVFFIGRGADYASAVEGALKLKEISYIHAEAYAAGELKHGPISLIEAGTPVIGIATDSQTALKTLSNMNEAKSRGASVLAFCSERFCKEFTEEGFDCLSLPDCPSEFSPALAACALQLFAYNAAVIRGRDVDKPRNLAKSVTVE